MRLKSPYWQVGVLSVGLLLLTAFNGLAAADQSQNDPPASDNNPAPPHDNPEVPLLQPLAGLSNEQLQRFAAGKDEFEKEHKGGLPLFNATKCSACHHQPDIGGSGPRYRSNFDFGFQSGGQFDPLTAQGGPLLREHALRGTPRQQIPPQANAFSLRRVPPLFGLGLVEAIPDEQLKALADENDANHDGISGRAVLSTTGRVQRFGSQDHVASLLEFVQKALEKELGITQTQLASLMRDMIAFSAPVPRDKIDNTVQEGEKVFRSLGCASCHNPSFTTAPGPFTTADGKEVINVAALQNQVIFPYSDFLLHDMGPELDDKVALGRQLGDGFGPGSSAVSSEYRTIPLWGLRFRGAFLHDGRAANLRQAILFHGGEAAAARAAFLALSAHDMATLEVFLRSL